MILNIGPPMISPSDLRNLWASIQSYCYLRIGNSPKDAEKESSYGKWGSMIHCNGTNSGIIGGKALSSMTIEHRR